MSYPPNAGRDEEDGAASPLMNGDEHAGHEKPEEDEEEIDLIRWVLLCV